MAAWDLWSSVHFVSDWQRPSQFVVRIVLLKIKYFSFHSSKRCSRSRDYPKKCARCIRNCSPRKTALDRADFLSDCCVSHASQPDCAGQGSEPDSCCESTGSCFILAADWPWLSELQGLHWKSENRTALPDRHCKVSNLLALWPFDNLKHISVWGEKNPHSLVGVNTRLQRRRQKRKSCSFQSQAVSSSIFCTSIYSSSSIHKKWQGNSKVLSIGAFPLWQPEVAHNVLGYLLIQLTLALQFVITCGRNIFWGHREMLGCLPARGAGDVIPALLSPSLFKPATHL